MRKSRSVVEDGSRGSAGSFGLEAVGRDKRHATEPDGQDEERRQYRVAELLSEGLLGRGCVGPRQTGAYHRRGRGRNDAETSRPARCGRYLFAGVAVCVAAAAAMQGCLDAIAKALACFPSLSVAGPSCLRAQHSATRFCG